MIRTDTQLRRAGNRLQQTKIELVEVEEKYSDVELEVMRAPLLEEIREIEDRIREYQALVNLSLQEALEGPLKKPILVENVGELLTSLRIAAGISQTELANEIGWHQSNLSRFESENYSSQTIAKIIEFVSALGVFLHVAPSPTELPIEPEIRIDEQLEMAVIFISPHDMVSTDMGKLKEDPIAYTTSINVATHTVPKNLVFTDKYVFDSVENINIVKH